ncbi:unnamed protein product [Caenorhabditis sp. 36 PRJEB53466]|nr:unnamed protein product [Caenorhabditis sp. 36 PRJEB53466]
MANKNQAPKKSPNTKNTNVKRKGRDQKAENTAATEERTAITAKSKVVAARKTASKASVNLDKKKSVTEMGTALKKSKSTVSVDKTTCDEKEKPKKKEKWTGEEAAVLFTKSLASVNMQAEYEEIQKMPANVERCKIWQANTGRNRHQDYKCYDDSRVIVQFCKNDYINGTKINVPNFAPLTYLVQLPKLDVVDAVEEFWRMVFQEQCQSLHIIARPDELQNPGIEKLFRQETGAWLYANGFFINTRKVEKKDAAKADQFVVELLPEGCSNSLMCTVFLHAYWKPFTGPERFAAQIRAAQQIAKNENAGSPIILASVHGAGRNAALLSLAVIVDQLGKGKEPKINDIVRTIREQRPMSVDSWSQYVSLYLATNWLIKAKMSSGPTTDEVVTRIKKFNEKAMHSVPTSTMKPPTEEIAI